jgi:hypothetical protein
MTTVAEQRQESEPALSSARYPAFSKKNAKLEKDITEDKKAKLKEKIEKITLRVDGNPEYSTEVNTLLEKAEERKNEGELHERLSVRVADTARS